MVFCVCVCCLCSVFSLMAGFFVFGLFFLYSK